MDGVLKHMVTMTESQSGEGPANVDHILLLKEIITCAKTCCHPVYCVRKVT